PTASTACAISTAVRVGVDLNSRCSRKCAAPATLGPSSRDPTPTHTPTDAERTDGTYSVTTRSPPGKVVRRTDLAAGGRGIGRRSARVRVRSGSVTVRCRRVVLDDDQRDLAAVVDVGDLHAELVTDLHHVLDLGDAL